MGGFLGAWAWLVPLLAGGVILLSLVLLFTSRRSRKQRSQGALELSNALASILLLLIAYLTDTFGGDTLPPTWILFIGVGGVVIAVAQALQGYFQKRSEARKAEEAWTWKVRSLVAHWPLPRVSEADPYAVLGVTESELANRYVQEGERPGYVSRDIDSRLEEALAASDFVLLVGHSKSGKSRTAFEAALRLHPLQPLIIPSEGKALVELFSLEPPLAWAPEPALVWLDDLQRFLGPNGLSPSLLNVLSQYQGRLKVLATLTAKRHDDYLRSTSDVDKDSQLVLRRFREVHLSSVLSPAETQRALALYPGEPPERLASGLGEHLVAAHQLTKKYGLGRETQPLGHTLVRAAIDWRRAGLLRPVPERALQRLASQYLEALRLPHVDLTEDSFEEGLKWAREPVGLHVALLSRKGGDGGERGFEAFDYLVDQVDRHGEPIPQESWETFLRFSSPAEALRVGVSAYQRKQNAVVRKALEQALQAGEPDISPRAATVLGAFLQEQREPVEAERYYRLALRLRADPVMVLARNNLGVLLMGRGELAEAEALFRAGLESANANEVAMAALNLGKVHQLRGELAEAEPLYRQAIASGQPEVMAMGLNNLGMLRWACGAQEEAETLYRQAMGAGDEHAAALASINLAILQQARGHLEEPEQVYRRFLDSADVEAAAWAGNNLGTLLLVRGERSEAERLFQRAMASGEVYVGAWAANNLAGLLAERGEVEEAERLFRQVLASRQPDVAAMARNNVGKLLMERGEVAEAERLFQQVLASGQREAMALASLNLGGIHQARGELEEAERLYRQALASHRLDAVAMATNNLGALLFQRGAWEEAGRLFEKAHASKQPQAAAFASFNLGRLCMERGEREEAERFYRQAIDSRHPHIAPRAAFLLGLLLHETGRGSEVERFFRMALDSSDKELVRLATTTLADLAGGQGAEAHV
jgi:Tfp pilus assembly protein PilF